MRLLKRGSRGRDVRRLQQLLGAAEFYTPVDGSFGPATDAAVRAFQTAHGLAVDGIAGPKTWVALQFFDVAAASLPPVGQAAVPANKGIAGRAACATTEKAVADLTLRYALVELAAGARETGGNNNGPWVRKYMGFEGQPWCVGFASWCYRKACHDLGVEPALTERYSSSKLVAEAKRKDLLITEVRQLTPDNCPLTAGCFFVVRGGPTGFRHTGIIRELGWQGDAPRLKYITTVEGNSRIPGEAGRDRVVTRRRGAGKLVIATLSR